MKRLTTDTPKDNFETMLNFVYGKDGRAHIRHDGENADAPLTDWARKQCLDRGCDEFPAESAEEIDQEICDCMMDFPDCPVALAYCFASQAVHLRDRLKMYEDIGLEPKEVEAVKAALMGREIAQITEFDGIPIARLQELAKSEKDNPPLTLEDLREMDMDPIYIVSGQFKDWRIPDLIDEGAYKGFVRFTDRSAEPMNEYGKTWLAYRRKLEEGT